MKVKSESEVAQLCPTLSDPVDCSLPGSPVPGILQARVLEWGAIAFSSIYPERTIIQEDTYTSMFTVALFTIARIWKQRKCTQTEDWIKKNSHTDMLLSHGRGK